MIRPLQINKLKKMDRVQIFFPFTISLHQRNSSFDFNWSWSASLIFKVIISIFRKRKEISSTDKMIWSQLGSVGRFDQIFNIAVALGVGLTIYRRMFFVLS